MLWEGLFCVLGRPILQSSYRFPQYCNVSKASYSASGLFLFSGSIGSISIAEVYLLAHLVVIATLIHVAMLFPDMNYREAEAVTVSCFAERMENMRRLSAYDSDAFSTGLYSPRSKGILSEYSDCPIQTMVWAALTSLGALYPQ